MGCAVSAPPSLRTNSSGENDRTAPPSGSAIRAPNGTGWLARRRRYSAQRRAESLEAQAVGVVDLVNVARFEISVDAGDGVVELPLIDTGA